MIMEIEERRTAVKPVYIEALCPYCHEELTLGEVVYMTDPPMYEYSCDKCNFSTTSRTRYPYVHFENEKGNSI